MAVVSMNFRISYPYQLPLVSRKCPANRWSSPLFISWLMVVACRCQC